MGRIKQGLDYFPLSTSFMHDRTIRRAMKQEGDVALVTYVETLSFIYSGKGYYVSAGEEFYEELADVLYHTDQEKVKRIIDLFVKNGLFDTEQFCRHGILTSADIQRQYLFITKRRSGKLIEPAYCLLDAEEIASLRPAKKRKASAQSIEDEADDDATSTANNATMEADSATSDSDCATFGAEMQTLSTQKKEKEKKGNENKTNETKINHLSNSPQGEDGGGTILKKRREMTEEDIDRLRPPHDGLKRNFDGLLENLRTYQIPPTEQYAIILKSNYGAIGHPVWKGFSTIRGSNGKIRQPGHYLLSVIS